MSVKRSKTKSESNTPAFLKSLASSHRATRVSALSTLRTYLDSQSALSVLEYRKLWKGLYYCLYMQDKPRNQQALSIDLASLIHLIPESGFVDFLRAFYITIRENWEGLNRHYLDKFLFLIRRCVRAAWEYLLKRDWENALVERYIEMVEAEALEPKEQKLANGLRFHVAQVWIDELEGVDVEHVAPVEMLRRPLRRLADGGRDKFVRKRIQSVLDDERWRDWGVDITNTDASVDTKDANADEDEWAGIDE